MKPQLVYDLPTRLFHWLFAVLFLTSFVIAKTVDDDLFWFDYHSLAGLTLGFVVLLRITWGVLGTKHSKFSDFALKPTDLINYFKGIYKGDKKRWAGHNPASSWAAVVMMILAIGLSITGYLMTSGPNKENFEDIHELFANIFIVIVILHILGIALHTVRFKEMIGLSMVDGKKMNVLESQSINTPRASIGILLIGLVVAFSLYVYRNYDKNNQSLNLFGNTLQLGEDSENKIESKMSESKDRNEEDETEGDDH